MHGFPVRMPIGHLYLFHAYTPPPPHPRGPCPFTTPTVKKHNIGNAYPRAGVRIWGCRVPGFRSARQVLCGDTSRLFLNHFTKHLSSVFGADRTLSQGPESRVPKTPNHPQRKPPLALFDFFLVLGNDFRQLFQGTIQHDILGGINYCNQCNVTIGAVLPWKEQIFRLQLQLFSPCHVGINCCKLIGEVFF